MELWTPIFLLFPWVKAVNISLHLVPKTNHLIRESYMDFILSRQASLLASSTIEFYKFTAGFFIDYLIAQSVFKPREISSNIMRAYLTEVKNRGVADATVHAHARGTKAFLRFLYEDGYIPTYKCKNAPYRAETDESPFHRRINTNSEGLQEAQR